MKRSGKLFSYIIIAAFIVASCSKETDTDFAGDNIYAIRRVTYKGKTTNNYLYNSNGKIAESQSFYFCERYTYDDNNRLVKVEEASSSESSQSNGLMTSQNSTFAWNYMYEYDQDGILKYIKLYHKNIVII